MKASLRTFTRGFLIFGFAIGLWQALVWLTGVPPFILPGPERVARRLWEARLLIAENAFVTFAQILLGLALGAFLGVATAFQLALSPLSRMVMRPIIVFAQAVPIFALAPILTLWLGYGPASKIVVVVLMIYFPIASAFFDGLMCTPQGYLDLARVMGAGPMRVVLSLRAPCAMPSLASGLRLAAVAAPFGAVIGEWVGASAGLGFLMTQSLARGQTPLAFAALTILCLLGLALYTAADRFARRLVPWQSHHGD